MGKFLHDLGQGVKKAAPVAGAAIGAAVGGPAGAAIGYKLGKAASGAIPGDKKGGGFTVPPANRSFSEASGDSASHAKAKYNFPGV